MTDMLNIGDIVKLPAVFRDRKLYRVVGWCDGSTRVTIVVPNSQKSDFENRTQQFTKLLKKVK